MFLYWKFGIFFKKLAEFIEFTLSNKRIPEFSLYNNNNNNNFSTTTIQAYGYAWHVRDKSAKSAL